MSTCTVGRLVTEGTTTEQEKKFKTIDLPFPFKYMSENRNNIDGERMVYYIACMYSFYLTNSFIRQKILGNGRDKQPDIFQIFTIIEKNPLISTNKQK